MNEINQTRFTPYATPDTLRQFIQLSKNLYDSYTKKNFGYEDINGSYYNGTVENWGSEMLLESRKVLLDKPSLKNIFIENTFDFYFDIQYSEYINTYDQQNMLCAVLRKDVLLSNKEYRLKFENITKVRIPRSESWSDPVVYNNDYYMMTTTPPKLLIDDEEIELKLTDIEQGNTVYYFSLGLNTGDLCDEINEEIDFLITNPITDSMNGFPLIWICVDMLRLLPNIDFQNNNFNDKPLLTIGTNGHDRAMMFPMFNHDNSIFNCILKVIPAVYDGFVEDIDTPLNYSTKIKEIHLLVYDNWLINPAQQPIQDICITYDDTYAKICLNKFQSIIDKDDPIFENLDDDFNVDDTLKWNFRRPQPGEYDYSEKKYKNNAYAYAPLYAFYSNTLTEGKIELTPGFIVKFDDKYLHEYEGMMENAMSGIHIDITADKSNNGVNKKNGTVHSLGDFDGLPKYFKYMIDDTIHRSHVEMYAIRDKLNDINQKAIDKQTAGIIIDSAIPQNELNLSYKDLPLVISYEGNRKFISDDEKADRRNNLSEVVYYDDYNFKTSQMSKFNKLPKFIYHGNRYFSLGLSGFDPDLEVGRVYVISNDKSVYENNDETNNKKDPLTFARICDIPTSFDQLISIKGVSPTFPFDRDYVRTEASFDDTDKDMLWNLDSDRSRLRILRSNDSIIFGFSTPSHPVYNMIHELNEQYPAYLNLNEKIHLNQQTEISYSIASQGEGYDIGDICSFYIGGICLKITITDVDNGAVTGFKFGTDEDSLTEYPELSYDEMVISNFPSRETSYTVNNISSNGEGLSILCTINEDVWNAKQMTTTDRSTLENQHRGSYYLQFDMYKNIHVWTLEISNNSKFVDSEILMGLPVYENSYISENDKSTHKFQDIMLYNLLQPISNDFTTSTAKDINKELPTTRTLSDNDDVSFINACNNNFQHSLFFYNDPPQDDQTYTATRCISEQVNYTQKHFENFIDSDLNLCYYDNSTNKLRFHDIIIDNRQIKTIQPELHIFDPRMTIHYKYTEVSKDLLYISDQSEVLIDDYLPSDGPIIVDSDGVLNRNLYIYDEFDDSVQEAYREELKSKSRNELLDIIRSTNEYALPLLCESTDKEFSDNELRNYIIENKFTWGIETICSDAEESVYRKPDLKLFRKKGEMIHIEPSKKPVGEQIKGRYVEMSSEVFDNKVKLGDGNFTTQMLFIFSIDDENLIPEELDDYHIYDDLDLDITEFSILIVNKVMYMASRYAENKYKWVRVNRENKEEVVL